MIGWRTVRCLDHSDIKHLVNHNNNLITPAEMGAGEQTQFILPNILLSSFLAVKFLFPLNSLKGISNPAYWYKIETKFSTGLENKTSITVSKAFSQLCHLSSGLLLSGLLSSGLLSSRLLSSKLLPSELLLTGLLLSELL